MEKLSSKKKGCDSNGNWYHEKCRKDNFNSEKKSASRSSLLSIGSQSMNSSHSEINDDHMSVQSFEQQIDINIPYLKCSENICVFGCDDTNNLKNISQNVITNVFIEKNLIIEKESKACEHHFVDQSLKELKFDELEQLKANSNKSSLNSEDIKSLLSSLRNKIKDNSGFKDNVFEEMSDEELRQTTGVSRYGFNQMKECLISKDLTTTGRPREISDSFSLGIYLTHMRSNLSERALGFRFGCSKSTIHKLKDRVRVCLERNFVNKWLGIKSNDINRDLVKVNTSFIAEALYELPSENIMTIWDGTYIYFDKSSDYVFQKKTYSVQKCRNLLKPMLCCTTNGYIVDVFGPFPASDNDATILNTIIEDISSGFKDFFKQNDHFFVDKGFRDSINLLEKNKMTAGMPTYAPIGSKRLSSEEANKSREVTKVRWVVEACFGLIKTRFKLFSNVWETKMANHLMSDFKIACAIHNMDTARFESDKFNQKAIVDRIKAKEKTPNRLFISIYYSCFSYFLFALTSKDFWTLLKRRNFTLIEVNSFKIDALEISDFPSITPDSLIIFACGQYQIEQVLLSLHKN